MGNFIEFLYSRFLLSDGVSVDTRTIRKDNLFFAISGPNFNGNQFAAQALEKGASYAVVDEEEYVTDERIILGKNGLKALQDLAIFHRNRFKRPVIGITGSNGKTTTRELISKILETKYIVHSTQENYNNHIGVPITLLHIHPQIEIAIIEMGANHVGEIAHLCDMAQPTHGLITNIGRAHTATFGGIEGVIRGKSELYDYLKKTDGQVFINIHDSVLSNMAKRFESPVKYPENDFRLLASSPLLTISLNGQAQETKMTGRYNYPNMAAAAALGRYFKIHDKAILNALASHEPKNARSQLLKQGSNTIILDAYNANPDSMKAALDNLADQQGEKLAILGDMNELENSDDQHREVLRYAKALGIAVFAVGEKIGQAAEAVNHANHFDSKGNLEERLKSLKLSNTTILLKASRSIELETILKSLEP